MNKPCERCERVREGQPINPAPPRDTIYGPPQYVCDECIDIEGCAYDPVDDA